MRWLKIAAVVALVAVGGALVVGAIQKTRIAAGQSQCINNLKMVGLTLHGYHDQNKRLPRATVGTPSKEFPPEDQLSWMEEIIPWLEAHMDPKWITNRKLPWDHPENQYVARKRPRVFSCPANPQISEEYLFSHYVGVCGVGADAAWLLLDHANAGAFGYERVTKLSDMKNGMASVMLVAETATDNGPWVRGGQATARGLDPNGASYLGEHGQFNSHHGGYLSAFTTQAAMADASVRTFTDDTADHVVESLATLAGR